MMPETPSATVRFEGEERQHPCDWTLAGRAWGLAEWQVRVYGRREPGTAERLRLDTALGQFEGRAIVAEVSIHGSQWESMLYGDGLLRYVPADTPGEAA